MGDKTGKWNTHVHVFDPARSPYSATRLYTPPAAPGEALFATSHADNFLLVQATVEAGPDDLLQQLARLSASEPSRVLRAALLVDLEDPQASSVVSRASALREAGVRCLRIHGRFQDSSETLISRLQSALSGPIASVARHQGWCISMQLPLESWVALGLFLRTNFADVNIIAEHCGGVVCPLSDNSASTFQRFLDMLREGLIYIKLGALHRRLSPGHSISEMQPVISSIATAGPNRLLWGSDWPHVDAEARGLHESPFLVVDEDAELDVICRCMPKTAIESMLRTTPAKLFY